MATDVETGKLKVFYENAHEEPVYRLYCLDNNKIVTGKYIYIVQISLNFIKAHQNSCKIEP